MRYSYGIVDEKKVLAYQPQLFRSIDDLLIFPSRDFTKWHSGIVEIIDGIYQINAKHLDNNKFFDTTDFDLLFGLAVNIDLELKNLFNLDDLTDFSHHYISTMDPKYKKRKNNFYGRYMHKIDRNMGEITPRMKYIHMMEIVDYAHRLWAGESRATLLNIKKRK